MPQKKPSREGARTRASIGKFVSEWKKRERAQKAREARFSKAFEKFDPAIRVALLRAESAARTKSPGALFTWLSECMRLGVIPPEWVWSNVFRILFVMAEAQRSKGRTGNAPAARKQYLIHERRWATVMYLKSRCPDRAPTWPKAYAAASEDLRGTLSQGAPDAICRSYKLARRFPLIANMLRPGNEDNCLNYCAGVYSSRNGVTNSDEFLTPG